MAESLKQRLGIVDLETGEVLEDKFILYTDKYKDKDFTKVFIAFSIEKIIKDNKIAHGSIRLLFYMSTKLDYDSLTVKIIPADAVKELGVSRMTYSKWVKDLIEAKIVKKINRYTFQLTPYTLARGKVKKAMLKDMKIIKKKA